MPLGEQGFLPDSVRISPERQGQIFTHSGQEPVSAITPNTYTIELRDKDFNLKGKIEDFVTSLKWDWNRIGGCGRCAMRISGDYLRFNISPDDDIRIYLPDETGNTATLWYRGYIQQVTPSLFSGTQTINLEIEGYSRWLKRIVVHDSGDKKIYTDTEISSIVSSVVDNFIVPNSSITKGTIDASSFVPDTLTFKTSSREVMRTLFDLLADVEYGVDANLEFFWRQQDSSIKHKYWLGDNVIKLKDKVDFNGIANEIFFEGGTVDDSTFKFKRSSPTSINKYGRHEVIISNGNITTNAVANQFITAQLKLRGKPIRQTNVQLRHITTRFEETLPIGAVSIVDPDVAQTSAIYGTVGAGGSGKIYGTTENGGSNQFYGGVKREQVDRVQYTLDTQKGFIDAQIQFGNSLNFSRASASLRRIQLNQDAQRQRSL